jgi:hypothetical protein
VDADVVWATLLDTIWRPNYYTTHPSVKLESAKIKGRWADEDSNYED